MLDIQIIKKNPEMVQEKSAQKGYDIDVNKVLDAYQESVEIRKDLDELLRKRNELIAKNKGKKPTESDIKQGKNLRERASKLEEDYREKHQNYMKELSKVPNLPLDSVPIGKSEEENRAVKKVGKIPEFNFKPKNHWEIAVAKDWIDKPRAVKVAGSRFLYIKGDLARLEFALWQFALDVLTDETQIKKIVSDNKLSISTKPFVFVLPPAMAKTAVFEATGRLNKEEQTYQIADEELWLNASAEHVLAPMYLNETLEEKDLPIRLVGYTTAFRKEAGTYGKDMEGMIRLHQFNKLEMESFNLPEKSEQEYKFMVAVQEYLMQALGLPYQVVVKCTADIGGPNAAGTDIDVWLPGQDKYRETHTADYMTDYQARRMKTKLRRKSGKLELVHNNDATAFSERPLIGIIENYQTKNGDVVVPKVLRAYMKGKEII